MVWVPRVQLKSSVTLCTGRSCCCADSWIRNFKYFHIPKMKLCRRLSGGFLFRAMQSCPCLCNDSAFAEVDEARLGNCRVLADGFQNRFGNLSVHADQGNGFGAGSGIAAAESKGGYI